jgi:cell division protease FtsH
MDQKAEASNQPSRRRKTPPPLPPGLDQKLADWPPQRWRSLIWYFIVILAFLWVWQEASHQFTVRTIAYSEFKSLVQQGRVAEAAIKETEIVGKVQPKALTKDQGQTTAHAATNAVAARTRPAPNTNKLVVPAQSDAGKSGSAQAEAYRFRTIRVEDPELVRDLEKARVAFNGVRQGFLSQLLLAWVLPIAVVVLIWRFLSRRMRGLGQGLMSFGASRAKLVAEKDTQVTFNDVAGCDEAKYELQEVVTFLKNPGRYKSLGATIPKGILLVGPPGTGKTLLARAVAGEAKVPFFLISGSDFVEMFVGVGAARVRDLFAKAKAQAPCIVFIDELDAIGRQRGVHMGPVDDEREQTLNQLLVGMDGFEPNVGVIVLAATNRPEVLDRALLRPGRFDRQVVVDAPDLNGRLAILRLHVRRKPLATGADLRKIAAQTPGFPGADLANAVNEAALLAARHGAKEIDQKDLEDAVEKIVAGPERKSRRLTEEEKRRVAYHEVGHALVATYSKHADAVHKITIIPHGHAALGYTMQLPTEDHYLMNRSALLDRLEGQLGGRAAEEVVLGEVSTGAENDLQQATALARRMVAMYGMSDVIGLAHCAQPQNPLLARGIEDGTWQRDCSEQTAREIDQEVKKLLAVVVALCWAWIVPMARDMYGAMSGPAAWMMTDTWDFTHLALLFAMWVVMMAGMMLPAAAPTMLLYAGVIRKSPEGGHARAHGYAFAGGYLLVWTAFSLLATALQRLRAHLLLLSPMMEAQSRVFGGALLMVALGLWYLLRGHG